MARLVIVLTKLILILAGLALFAVLVLALALVLRPDLSKPGLEILAGKLGAKLEIQQLDFQTSPVRLELKGVHLAARGSKQSLNMEQVLIEPDLRWPIANQPLLRLVRIKGLTATASPGPEASSHAPDPTPLAWIFLTHELELLDWRLAWSQPGLNLNFFGPSLTLKPAEEGDLRLKALGTFGADFSEGNITGSVKLNGIMNQDPALSGSLELEQAAVSGREIRGPLDLLLRFRLTPQGTEFPVVRMSMPQLKYRPASAAQPVAAALYLEARGRGDLKGEALSFDITKLESPGILSGTGGVSFGASSGWRGNLIGRFGDINKLKQIIKHILPKSLEDIDIQGGLPFDSKITQAGDSFRINTQINLQELETTWPSQALKAKLQGLLQLIWATHGAPRLKGELKVSGAIKQETINADGFELHLPIDLDPGRPKPQTVELRLPAGSLKVMGKAYDAGALDLRGRLTWDLNSLFNFELQELRLENLGSFKGAWNLDRGELQGWLQGDELKAATLASSLSPWLGDQVIQWQPSGNLGLRLNFHELLTRPNLRIRLDSQDLGFASPDGMIMAQGLSPELDLKLGLSGQTEFDGQLDLKAGQALWGTLFGSFKEMPFSLGLKGRIPSPARFEALEINAALGGAAKVSFSGRIGRQQKAWQTQGTLGFSSPEIKPLFDTFVREPLSASNPGLKDMQARGAADLKLDLDGSLDNLHMKGRLDIQKASLSAQEAQPIFSGLELSLPLEYRLGASEVKSLDQGQVEQWGQLKLAGLNLGSIQIKELDLPVSLIPNRLYVKGNLEFPLLGGKLRLTGLRVNEPLSAQYQGMLAADLKGLDFASLDLGGKKLEGNLGGRLAPITISGQGIQTKGELNGKLMGGKLNIKDISVAQPLNSNRAFKMSLTFNGLDLESISQSLDVGRVTGKISGYVDDMVVAFDQPQAFTMWLKSDPGSPFEQMVSLKAVNTISVLGTGSSLPDIGMGLFASFFTEFPYDAIGFQCTLKNDVFKVKGLIVDGGVEYLVKRPFWGGINVVNRNQDNRITFSDMLERLKRVNRPIQKD